ncbi:serine/threonine-protein kinase [Tundrisphaera sp. TA3]|uniref:serine/threonine-protein kinase n=1 Tax=Tundrisphaera sp. TA3 TaxID=3435775 RepID=UPI003EB98454
MADHGPYLDAKPDEAPGAPPDVLTRPEALEADVRVGDFRIERRVGSGGMGIVYQARQISLDRVVALKVLGNALDRPDDIARFRREAQAVAKLDHPHIAGVYFVGQDRQLCYMAMEFVDGVSLRRVVESMARASSASIEAAVADLAGHQTEAPEVRFDDTTASIHTYHIREAENATPYVTEVATVPRGRTTSIEHIRRSVEIIRDAAFALAHAHGRGVVHRDIKPENLLLDRDGGVRLIDFGIARFFEDATITHTGQLIGTPMYMSPEQAIGRLELDHRTDIYSLGLVLYELLILGRPLVAPSREGVLRQVVTKALTPVSQLNPNVSPALEGVLHKATAKDPDNRYQDAGQFAADLQNVLDGKPVSAPPYRFRFDEREIEAERPRVVIGISFEFFLVAILSGCWTAVLCALNPEVRYLLGFTGGVSQVALGGMAIAVGMLAVSWAILSGWWWGRWSGMLTCFILLLISLRLVYEFAEDRNKMASHLFFATTGPPSLMALATIATMVSLGSSQVGHWFRLAHRVRSERGRRRRVGG